MQGQYLSAVWVPPPLLSFRITDNEGLNAAETCFAFALVNVEFYNQRPDFFISFYSFSFHFFAL